MNKPKNKDKIKDKNNEDISEYNSVGYFELPNCSYYEGDFKTTTISSNGFTTVSKIREGYGKLVHRGLLKSKIGEEYYIGYWKNDQFHGKGEYYYSNGDVYKGEFKEGQHDGKGVLTCVNGNKYEGYFKNHRFHGQGKFYDIDGIIWEGEFRDGFYSSENQPQLKEEKRIINKIKEMIKIPYDSFYKEWESKYSKIDKKTAKDILSQFFGNSENIGEYIKEPYPKLEDKNNDKWNEAFKFAFSISNNNTNIVSHNLQMLGYLEDDNINNSNNTNCYYKVNVGMSDGEYLTIDPDRILERQFNENLESGQIIEIISNLSERTVYLSLAYNKLLSKWLVVSFKDETVKTKK